MIMHCLGTSASDRFNGENEVAFCLSGYIACMDMKGALTNWCAVIYISIGFQ